MKFPISRIKEDLKPNERCEVYCQQSCGSCKETDPSKPIEPLEIGQDILKLVFISCDYRSLKTFQPLNVFVGPTICTVFPFDCMFCIFSASRYFELQIQESTTKFAYKITQLQGKNNLEGRQTWEKQVCSSIYFI